MLNNVQRLFSHHMVHTFGCDYSTGGITLDALQAKLRNFLETCTAEGPPHDTYLIFYSGHTCKGTGAWALAGERVRKGQLAGHLKAPACELTIPEVVFFFYHIIPSCLCQYPEG